MRISLAQEQLLNQLASFLYDFLPGQPHPFADQSISFAGIARSLRLGGFWQGGSKMPAIAKLLKQTLESEQQKFCPLILEIVRKGITYRESKANPISREEIGALNDLLEKLAFKIPELHDPRFLDGLPSSENKEPMRLSEAERTKLAAQLIQLTSLDPVPRGYAFETFLNDVFNAFEMAPRDAFRLVGEQIDGSLQFQGETYLIEATWRNDKVGQEELLAFSGKVTGKARWSRGLYIAYSGFSSDGLEAFIRGKPTAIVCMDGLDIHEVLDKGLDLRKVLERKGRRAAETNDAFVPVGQLFA